MSNLQTTLKDEVAWIAQCLINTSEEDEHGIFWKTLHRQPYGELYAQVNEEIYNGVSGISLFFISIYRHTKESEYLRIAKKSISWSLNYIKNSPTKYYTFYTGGVGVIYALIKLYEVTGDQSYLDDANHLFSDLEEGIINDVKIDDILSGNAGNLFVIVYLYTYTENPDQYRIIKFLINKLINNTRISRQGLKWGYLNNALDSFTGMSHGASGIAHVLFEVAQAIDYPELNWIAEKAFSFENEYYSQSLSSWIDMRISSDHKADEHIINQGLSFYLRNLRDVNAWAHGTAGMSLARLNAYELLTNDSNNKRILEAAIKVTLKDINKETRFLNFTLSTGLGSWIELYLTASEILNKPKLKKYAEFLTEKAIEQKENTGFYGSGWYADKSDPALLVGTAGIGYLYLQLLDKASDSILLPKIKSKIPRPFEDKISIPLMRKKIYGKYLKRTSLILKKFAPNLDIIYSSKPQENITGICKKIEYIIYNLPASQYVLAQDVFKLELMAIKMLICPDYNIYREQKYDFFKAQLERADHLDVHEFYNMSFKISKHVKIIKTKWFWPLNEKKICLNNLHAKANSFYIILRLEIDRLEEFYPNQFSALLLKVLEKQQSFTDLMNFLKSRFNVENEDLLKTKLVQQLKYFIRQWFIEIKEK